MADLAKVIHGIDKPAAPEVKADAAWRRVAIYTMLRLLTTQDLDSLDASWIRQELSRAGIDESEADGFFALYREHR